MKRNDILWKAALEDLFDDFLRFFYPDADKLFNFDKGFEYLDKELEQLFPPDKDEFTPRYVDKLVKAFTAAGNEEWILVHIEVQGYADKDFSKRMFQYYYRILDKYDKPVTAFAIFADTNKNFRPRQYERDFLGTKVTYSFNTYKIIENDDKILEASDNPFALAVLSAKLMLSNPKISDIQLLNKAYDLAKLLLTKQMPKNKVRKLMSFLRYYLHFENNEIMDKFEEEIANLTERKATMGIEEFLLDQAEKKGIEKGLEKGLEQGMEKGKVQGRMEGILETAAKMKRSGLEIGIIADITGLSADEIERL